MVKKNKKQLDLSEVGEPIENSLQSSEIKELDIVDILNDNMANVQKSIDKMEEQLDTDPEEPNEQEQYDQDEQYDQEEEYSYEEGSEEVPNYINSYEETEEEEVVDEPVNNIEILHAQQLNNKRDLIYKIQQLQSKLYDVELNPKNFTTADSLSELQSEYDRLTRIRHQKSTRDWYRKILFGVTKGLEWVNHKWDPVGLKLDGWSTEVASNAEDFDEIFDELTEKYGEFGGIEKKIPPEVRLVGIILYSGITYSISQTLTSKYNDRPEFSEVINKDPVLRERFLKTATELQLEKQQPQVSKLYSSVKEYFQNEQNEQNKQANMRNFMTRLDNSDLEINELDL